jgi:SAM-dependent methyltransferase
MDGADPDRWSAHAMRWAELWGLFSDPARLAVATAAGIGPGTRVLDAGCGSGELLELLEDLGAEVAGVDPAPAMLDLARLRVPRADIRLGTFSRLPWADESFDVAMAFNALEFANDIDAALQEMARVVVKGQIIALSNWAEGEKNDLNTLELAAAAAVGEQVPPDGKLRSPGGLERLLRGAGLELISAGLVEVPWEAKDSETLLQGVLLGADSDSTAAKTPAVLSAASSFKKRDGGYRLVNFFRYAVARTSFP